MIDPGAQMRKYLVLLLVLCGAGCTQYPRTSTYREPPAADDGFRPLAGFECDDGSIGPTAEACRAAVAEAPPVAPRSIRAATKPNPTPVAYTPPVPAPQPAAVASVPVPQEAPPAQNSKELKAALMAAGIAALMVGESRAAYYATGHPCACPDDRTRNGRSCGNMSAYVRPGGARPLCYPGDVTAAMIESYRQRQASR
jgi:hypothetical protein